MSQETKCWCGERELRPFSEAYLRCEQCQTLVCRTAAAPGFTDVDASERGFYGRDYWFDHQTADLGLPTLLERARSDLVERAPYWLRTVLKHKLPPARVLEVGSGPGSLLALLTWAGYDAIGLELSPWVVEHTARTFGVRVLRNTLEDLEAEAASFDVIAMMDVLEHLADPRGSLRRCLELLKPDGVLVVQTPRYEEGRSWQDLVDGHSPFVQLLVEPEHLFLFSRSSIGELLAGLGLASVVFEEPIYPAHDMFFTASRETVPEHREEDIDAALDASSGGRLVRGLLDTVDQVRRLDSTATSLRRQLDERAGQIATLQATAADRLVLLEKANRERAMFEAAAADRLSALTAAEEHLREAGRAAERCEVLEAAARERLALIERLSGECQQFESAAVQRLAALQTTEAARSALAAEVERLRVALQLRDRRVLDLERAVDRTHLDLERAARLERERHEASRPALHGGPLAALWRRWRGAGRES